MTSSRLVRAGGQTFVAATPVGEPEVRYRVLRESEVGFEEKGRQPTAEEAAAVREPYVPPSVTRRREASAA